MAKVMKANITSEVLSWAREKSKYSIAEVAEKFLSRKERTTDKLEVWQNRIASWEQGTEDRET